MLQKLINHNDDISRLVELGLSISVVDNHLVIDDIPYVNVQGEVNKGRLVSTLNLRGFKTLKPETHTIFFQGDNPCDVNGAIINAIRHKDKSQKLGKSIEVDRSFSSKPNGGYKDYFEKIHTYTKIISGPAMKLDVGVTPYTNRIVDKQQGSTVFNYVDTDSARSGVTEIVQKLEGLKVGIIGLGGTGSYILDGVSKTPVAEIHIFDDDIFEQHNAFRAPGFASLDEIEKAIPKVDYHGDRASYLHKGIVKHNCRISADNLTLLKDLDFVFVSVDDGPSRKAIFDFLTGLRKQFIDVGIGLEKVDSKLFGSVRTTICVPNSYDEVALLMNYTSRNDDVYDSNIQVSELNALNASLALIHWKKCFGVYDDQRGHINLTYSINDSSIAKVKRSEL